MNRRTAMTLWGLSMCSLLAAVPAVSAYDIPEGSPIAEPLKRAEQAVAAIVAVPDGQRNFDNTLGAIDDLIVRLRLDTEMMQFMAYVSTDAEERQRGQQAEEDIRNWYIELSKREDLYKAVKAYADTQPKLEGEQARILEHTMRDYRRAGMELPADRRAELKNLELEENKLVLEFDKNIRDDETRVPLTAEELKGVPEDVLANVPKSGEMYLCGLDAPTYMGIQTFCDNETTREKMYIAYKRKGGRQNVDLLERILRLRAQQADLLGYRNNAQYATETRMAKNPETVMKFYAELRPLLRKKSEQDFAEYTAAKREHTGSPGAKLQAWDQFFYHNWLLKNKYSVDSEKVREYFPMKSVVDALFDVTQRLFGLEYRDVTAEAASRNRPLWHPDVRLYEVRDTGSGEVLGEFYLDPYPRDNKYGHFAQFSLFPRKVWSDGTVQKPLVAIVCNFPPPSPDKPSLMTHEDVETFFHEFGHGLHSILTDVDYAQFSGTATALDFVELPSQMFENWVWNPDVLKTFARHYKTGEPLPDELLNAMIAAHNVGSGIDGERQLFYGMIDMTYHTAPEGKIDTTQTGMEVMSECELFPPVPQTHFQAGFGHLMHYNSGYYGYLWSKVYAQDMFTYFKQHGLLNPEAGKFYREKVLARGGSVDEMEMLVDFLGRKPRMEPFLEYLGLK